MQCCIYAIDIAMDRFAISSGWRMWHCRRPKIILARMRLWASMLEYLGSPIPPEKEFFNLLTLSLRPRTLKPVDNVEVTQGKPRTNHHTRGLWRGGEDRTQLFERKPKESSNGEPLGAGLQTIYTTIHGGCMRLFVGLGTDIKGGSVHSTRHRSRLLQDKMRR